MRKLLAKKNLCKRLGLPDFGGAFSGMWEIVLLAWISCIEFVKETTLVTSKQCPQF